MKPVKFSYLAPKSIASAAEMLAEPDVEAKVLAGGQSLGPLLNFRLSTPGVLVDINAVDGLDTITTDSAWLRLGATVRQRDAERSSEVATACPLISYALPHVAHRTIRNRGTVVGSIAHADPAAELPAVALVLNAQIEAVSVRGPRTIPASDFFQSYFTTSLAEDELVTAVRFPVARAGSRFSWTEFAPRDGDFAIVGVAAHLMLDNEDKLVELRLAYSGVSGVPVRLDNLEPDLVGDYLSDGAIRAMATAAAAAVDPTSDLIASADYRRHLVAILTRRGLMTALGSPIS